MVKLNTKTKKYLRYAATALLLTGIVTVTGFLSFTGMLSLYNSIYLAIAAFVLGGAIEGTVYATYINKSLLKIFSDDYLQDQLYSKLLKELSKQPNQSAFLQDYNSLLSRIAFMEDNHDHSHKEELINAQRSLKWMKHDFVKFMKGQTTAANDDFHNDLSVLIKNEQKRALENEIKTKKRRGRWSWILNIGAGFSSFLVGLEAAQSSFAAISSYFGLALSGAALTASIVSIAVIGAIAYTLLIHHTITKIIQNDTVQKWASKTKAFFSQRPQNWKEGLKYAASALGVTFILALSIFATITTAGTWWEAAEVGAKMLPGLARFAHAIRAGAVSLMGVTSLLFNLDRSFQSLKVLRQRITHIGDEIGELKNQTKAQYQRYKTNENKFQFYNPFRIINAAITLPFKTVTFAGHLISMAVMGVRVPGIPAGLSTSSNVLNEWLVDQDIIYQHHHTAKECCSRPDSPVMEAKAAPAQQSQHQHQHNDENHDHNHLDLINLFLNYVILMPLHFLETAWDYGFSQKNTPDKPRLNLGQAFKKSLQGIPAPMPELPPIQLSIATLQREKSNRLGRAKEKNSADYSKERGHEVITELEQEILNPGNLHRTYLQNGKINSASFYAGHKNLGKSTKKVCDKFIEIANADQYQMAAPGA